MVMKCVMQIRTLWLYLLLAIKTHTEFHKKREKKQPITYVDECASQMRSYLKQYQLVIRRK